MIYTAKSRVGLAADGKTLVPAESPEAVSLFAADGGTRSEKDVAGKVNVDKFFTTSKAAETKTHTAPVGSTRVISTAAPKTATVAKIKRKR